MSRSILVVLAISECDHYNNHVDFFNFIIYGVNLFC